MDLLTIELVSKASSQLYPNNTLSSFTNFLTEQVNLEGQREVAISRIFNSSKYRNVTEGNFMFFDANFSKITQPYYLESGLYSSLTDIVETMNTLLQERRNHSDTSIRIKFNRVTQKIEVYLANEESS